MKFLTIEKIKKQCHLDDWQMEDQGELIEAYGCAAEDAVLNCCNRDVTELYETYGCIPKGLEVAALMLAADMYNHRGTNTPMAVNQLPGFDMLVKPYVQTTSKNDNNGRHCNL